MPPRKTQARPAPRTRAQQCAYLEHGRRCSSRKTSGNPPLCDPHRIVLEQAAHAPPRDILANLLGSLLTGQRVPPEHLGAAVIGTVRDVLLGVPDLTRARRAAAFHRMAADHAAAQARRASGTPPPPPPPDRSVQNEYERRQACQVLGFDPKETITEAAIRRRRQKLAREHHPDAGGSVEAMAAVNAAADVLLAALARDRVGSEKARGER